MSVQATGPFLWGGGKMMEQRGDGDVRDKVRGCLLGVAVGDALGAPFEHVRPGEVNQAMERMGLAEQLTDSVRPEG